jgi:glycosyltransferase involved in cell wall biosynthesis
VPVDVPPVPDVTIVISTYNRCGQLRHALESLLDQEADGTRWELLVVDNNSTDQTRATVESFIGRATVPLRYIFERRQGLSFGRNAGIACATAPIIAFTDDDVRPSPDWVRSITRAFEEHPDVDFVGGKVLPRWPGSVPAWLTADHWSPLALVDYGDEPFVAHPGRPSCLVGANLAFRREVFDRVGPFAPRLQRIGDGIGSAEDYDMQMRVWRAGGLGLYAPDMVVTTDVQPERITKAYHRRWYAGHGRFSALMRLKDCTSPEGAVVAERTQASRLFGVPSFVYLELIYSVGRWLNAAVRGDESSAFYHENRARHCLYYIRQRYQDHATGRSHSGIAEVSQFVSSVVRKRLGAHLPRSQPSR